RGAGEVRGRARGRVGGVRATARRRHAAQRRRQSRRREVRPAQERGVQDAVAGGGLMEERRSYPVRRIIFASGLGTMIEWYDFYIFGSLNVVLSQLMFPAGDPTWAQIKTWALFATGFLVRPFGASLAVKESMSDATFKSWGWRLPFLLSIILVGMSLYIRMRLQESPLYAALKREGQTSVAPLKESFARWSNFKIVLLVLFGATAGQGIVWYTGQFYALSFLQNTMKLDLVRSSIIVAVAIFLAMPFFTVFGALSDRVGRLKIMMAGNLLAAITYLPIYHAMKASA